MIFEAAQGLHFLKHLFPFEVLSSPGLLSISVYITAVILGKIASLFLLLLHETLSPLSQMDLLSFPKERQISVYLD